jgi:dTDP-4-dehydrorhamnose 3,5-epimerase
MKTHATGFEGLTIIEPQVFGDQRGYFFEPYNRERFKTHGLDFDFLQDNESFSKYGTLRGLHFQVGNFAQAKLVRVIEGAVWDVVVDLRAHSSTYKQWFGVELTGENKKMLMISRGFAHGFVVTSPTALFAYKVDNVYSPQNESGILWNDPSLNIDWKIPYSDVLLSEKDKKLPRL